MKKIGILTFHRSINYGAFMQSYSLSKMIQKRFPDSKVEIIDYYSQIMEDIYKPKITLSDIRHPIFSYLKRKQYYKFHDALQALPLSQTSICSDGETEKVLSAYENVYDVFIVGSDAVWNWCKRGFPNPYLMHFNENVIKLSYAASAFGMDRSFLGEKEKHYFKESLDEFQYIGVRDQYTADLVKEVAPTSQPKFTCDPTVFLNLDDVYAELGKTREEFKNYIYNKYNLPKNKKLIGLMGAPNSLMREFKKRNKNTYCFVGLYSYSKYADIQMVDLSPFEWAAVFSLFDLTITSFFHGTLLSLRNYTPVINVDFNQFSKNNEGKIHDVMRRMDLLDYHFEDQDLTEEMIKQIESALSHQKELSNKIKNKLEALSMSSEGFFDSLEDFVK